MKAFGKKVLCLTIACVFACGFVGVSSTYYVSPNGNDLHPGTNWSSAKRTIQCAVDSAADGDTVFVTNGIYVLTEQITITNGVTVRSVNGEGVSIVDGGHPTIAIRCVEVAHSNAFLVGFTVRNGCPGSTSDGDGGGIRVNGGTISDCTIVSNTAQWYGGGVYVSRQGVVERCRLMWNTAQIGAALSCRGNGEGGGTDGVALAEVRNCLIAGNTPTFFHGGSVHVADDAIIENCTIVGNSDVGVWSASGVVRNCIVYLNQSGDYVGSGQCSYSCIATEVAGKGNTDSLPLFLSPGAGFGVKLTVGDYRLRPMSPCIDSGTASDWMSAATDIAGNPRIAGAVVDMGAYEQDDASLLPSPGGVSASDGAMSNRIAVSWTAVEVATGYELWRNAESNSVTAKRLATTPLTSYDDFSAARSVRYYYWVVATNDSQCSDYAGGDPGWYGMQPGLSLAVLCDYDGDGRSDPTVYGRASGEWYVHSITGGAVVAGIVFGGAGFTPVPGDYDGDGRNDLAVYERSTGNWHVRGVTGSNIVEVAQWGGPGMIPVWGDYDGDGVYDLGVYEETSGRWYVRSVSGDIIVSGEEFGGQEFQPVPGDYNGDGVFDLAVYSLWSGKWWIRSLSGTVILSGEDWGAPGFVAVPGDFDGDGCSDMAVSSIYFWQMRRVDGGVICPGFRLGMEGCTSVFGDYDGDGICDYAVYNEDMRWWYIFTVSEDSVWGGTFGAQGGRAVCGMYVCDDTPTVILNPVYRLFSTGSASSTSEHLWTINEDEATTMWRYMSWNLEGTAWYALAEQSGEAIPLYRLYSPTGRLHHYTIDSVEYDVLTTSGSWVGEGVQYYVWSNSEDDRLPVYRFYNIATGLHHFTMDVEETFWLINHPESGWRYETIAFYVYGSE